MIKMDFNVAVALFASERTILNFTEWLLFNGIEVVEDERSEENGN